MESTFIGLWIFGWNKLSPGPGRRVALVGATGAGKSTVAAVLFRFVDLSSGTALLNGRDLAGWEGEPGLMKSWCGRA